MYPGCIFLGNVGWMYLGLVLAIGELLINFFVPIHFKFVVKVCVTRVGT